MTMPRDPQDAAHINPSGAESTATVRNTEPVTTRAAAPPSSRPTASPAPVATPRPAPPRTGKDTESGTGTKITAAALVAGAAALANKVRKEAPKKAREVREKRLAERRIIITEVGGRPVAFGPYRDEQAARQDLTRIPGAPQVLELKSRTARSGSPDGDRTNTP
jgi:hypothetical protein